MTVHVLDHGRHSSLLLPASDGTYHRWAYGDWRYYALADKGFTSSFAALFLPTQATLGYQNVTAKDSVGVVVTKRYSIVVSKHDVIDLHQKLKAIFDDSAQLKSSQKYPLEFAHHPQNYHLLHNSNKVVALWLTDLGCEVSKYPIYANWKLQQ